VSLKTVSIADIAAPDKRSIAIGPFGSSLKADLYVPSGVPVVRGQNIKDGGELDESDLVFVEPETAARFPACLLNEGDLVFPHRGAIGRVGIVGKRQMLMSSSMMKLTVDPLKADPRFVFYYFRGPGQNELLMRASTVGTPGIGQPLTSLRDIPIQLPELHQQRAIAEVLGALDDKVIANTTLAESIAELAMAEFSRAYQRAHQVLTLSELVTTQYGLTTSAHELHGPKFLRVTDINKKPWIEWDSTPNCTVSNLELEKYRVSPGDILVARMADPGKAAFIDEGDPESVFASYLVRLKPHDPAQALYLYYFLKSPRYLEYAEGAMTGSVQRNMNAKVIVATDISVPESDHILQFNAAVRPLRRLIQSHLDENHTLAMTRDALLPQLMSGNLRVKDAEKVLEKAGV
jgi:type I restriction enzyme S subunit